MNRNKRCQYVATVVETSVQQNQLPQSQRQHDDRQQRRDSQQQFQFSTNEAFSSLAEDVASRDLRSDTASEFEANMRASTEPDRGAANANLMALSSIQQLQHNRLPSSASNISLASWPMGSPHARQNIPDQLPDGPSPFGDAAMSPDWLRRNVYPFGTTASENGEATPRWQRNGTWPERSPFMPTNASISGQLDDGNAMSGIANDDLNFDLLGSLGILTRNRITPAPSSQQSPASTPSFGMRMARPAGNVATNDRKPSASANDDDGSRVTLHEAVKTAYGEAPLSAVALRRSFEANERQRSCPFHKLNTDDDNVRIVRGYPRTMTRPGIYPPFVHHKLYRCAAGDVAEPLARAFCCVGAFYASVPTSETFVYSLINEESSKLVKGFVSLRFTIAAIVFVLTPTRISINGPARISTCWRSYTPCVFTRFSGSL